jgi:hypothetical protein
MSEPNKLYQDKPEKRRTVIIDWAGGTPLYNALPNCKHEIVDGYGWSGIRCKKCGGWYCA